MARKSSKRKSRGESLGAEVKLEINGTATFGKNNTIEETNSQDPIGNSNDYEPLHTGGIMCSTGPLNSLMRLNELPAVDELGSGNLEDL